MSLKELLQKNNFHFNKRLGQNFISDVNLLKSIVDKAEINLSDTVVEIGVGAGTLTRELSKNAMRVYGFEVDKNLQPVLAENLSGVENTEIVFKDFLRVDLNAFEKELDSDYVVVANLPYYVTTPILMRLIEESSSCKKIVIMVQKEVGLRLSAKADTSEYGSVTAAVDAVGNAKIVLEVSRKMFFPEPNVDSCVIKIDINRNKFDIASHKAYRDTVRAAFASRRKTLANNLINSFHISRSKAEEIILKVNLPIAIRGEALDTNKFVELSNLLYNLKIIE